MNAVAVVREHWALRRQIGERVHDLTVVYTLAFIEGRFQIPGNHRSSSRGRLVA